MLNPYKVWKDDKETNFRPVKLKGKFRCRVCGQNVNDLKNHVKDIHGGRRAWQSYLAAEELERQRIDNVFRSDFNLVLEGYKRENITK